MKRIISILLLICLSFTAFVFADEEQPAPQLRSEAARYMKIGLYYQTTAVESFTVKSDSGFIIAKGDSKGWKEEDIHTDATELTVKVSNGAASLSDANGELLSNLKGYVVLSAAENPEERVVTIKSRKYRDGFTATVYGGNSLNVINYIELEHYVRGILANEMSYLYLLEALKAQAVAARSYAVKNLNNHSAYGFDLCTGQHCQVYRGISSEYESTDRAVAETSQEVLLYNGRIVPGYYYSTSGGYCMNSEDVWLNPLGYCKSMIDDFAADYKWSNSWTMEAIGEKLKTAGRDIGTVTGVQITARNENGTAREVTIYGTKGNAVYTKSTMQSFFGCKSFVFAFGPAEFVWSADAKTAVADPISLASSSAEGIQSGEVITVLGAAGKTADVDLKEVRITNGRSVYSPSITENSGYSDDIITGTVYIAGNGYGHGVGMPQTSARNMANLGYAYQDILKYYYKGVEISTLEPLVPAETAEAASSGE